MCATRVTLFFVCVWLSAACDDDESPARDAATGDAAGGGEDAGGRDGGGGEGEGEDAGSDASVLPTCTANASTVDELVAGVAALGPGVTLCLAPGTYLLPSRVSFTADTSGLAGDVATVVARDGAGTVTIDAGGDEEAFYFTGATNVVLRALRFTGGRFHGVKIDPPSSDIEIVDSAFFDNFAGAPEAGQYSDIKGCCLVERVTVRDSEFFQQTEFPSGDNFQAIDCNGCREWVVSNNRFHDVRGAGYSVNIQFKSGSTGTIIERNVIWNCGIGIDYGGFGDPAQWGNETHEHVGGIVRNNVIWGCADAGISALGTRDGKIYNNTLWNNGFTPDVRRYADNLDVRNNIFDRALNLRDGTTATQSNNVVLAAPDDASLFVDPAAGDFHLAPGAAAAMDQGADLAPDVVDDMDGDPRPNGAAYDVGADER